MGVKKAVEAAEEALKENAQTRSATVYTLGPLIHNPTVLADLESRGLQVLSSEDIPHIAKNSVVVIRAHGTTPKVVDGLKGMGANVVDATCPRVHLSQKRAAEWSAQGYDIVIAGDKNHGEVTSISAFAQGRVTVVQTSGEARSLELAEKSVLIAQTTFSPSEFEKISSLLKAKNPALVVFNSICPATMKRQLALQDLQGKVDGIVVIGGRVSANTRRLYETANKIAAHAALIETAAEIPDEFYSLATVGISAGASTPENVIRSVEERLLSHAK